MTDEFPMTTPIGYFTVTTEVPLTYSLTPDSMFRVLAVLCLPFQLQGQATISRVECALTHDNNWPGMAAEIDAFALFWSFVREAKEAGATTIRWTPEPEDDPAYEKYREHQLGW